MADVWQLVHAERRALIAFLEGVDDARWDTPSLCPGWRVREVVAHQIATAETTRLGFLMGMVLAGFDFDRENRNGVDREIGPAAQMLERFRSVADRTSGPPAPQDTRLVEVVVHGEDIRRPLGAVGEYPVEAVERALRLQARTGTGTGGAKGHVAGLRVRATDADVTIGDGPEVAGPLLALLLAISGRTVALPELGGEGVATLVERLS